MAILSIFIVASALWTMTASSAELVIQLTDVKGAPLALNNAVVYAEPIDGPLPTEVAYMTKITPAPIEDTFEFETINVITCKDFPAYQPVFRIHPSVCHYIHHLSARQIVTI